MSRTVKYVFSALVMSAMLMSWGIGIISMIIPIIAVIMLWGKPGTNVLQLTIIILYIVGWKLLGTGLQQVRIIKRYDRISEYRGWLRIIISLLITALSVYAIFVVL